MYHSKMFKVILLVLLMSPLIIANQSTLRTLIYGMNEQTTHQMNTNSPLYKLIYKKSSIGLTKPIEMEVANPIPMEQAKPITTDKTSDEISNLLKRVILVICGFVIYNLKTYSDP